MLAFAVAGVSLAFAIAGALTAAAGDDSWLRLCVRQDERVRLLCTNVGIALDMFRRCCNLEGNSSVNFRTFVLRETNVIMTQICPHLNHAA